jgi:transcriptional repressor NrdR
MRCPECQHLESRVVDSRATGDAIRRRRACEACGWRFTTYERVERPQLWILKKRGFREPYAHEKVLHGIALACRKRPVGADQLDEAAAAVRALLEQRRESPVPSAAVGEAVMEVLRDLDAVAYVRFASVYREFESAEEFAEVLRPWTEPE